MARPALVRLVRQITAAGGGTVEGGLEYVLDQVREGKTIAQIAAPLGVSRAMIYRYIDHLDGPIGKMGGEATRQFKRARVESASAHAERSLELVDEPVIDQIDVQQRREQVRTRQWLAERLDRDSFGSRPETQQVFIGELHLAALQKTGGPEQQLLEAGRETVVEASEVDCELEDLL